MLMIGKYTLWRKMMSIKMSNVVINRKMNEILSKQYARRLIPDESGGYVATIQEFPGCIAEGETADEAIKNLNEVAASWVKVALLNGYEIREPVSFDGYSGKIALRIPRGLHKQAAELAEQEETSINQLLVTAIAQYVASKVAHIKVAESFIIEMRKIMSEGVITFCQSNPLTLSLSIVTPIPQKRLVDAGTTFEGHEISKETYALRAVLQ